MTAFNLAKTLAKFTIDFTELYEAWDPEQLIMQVDASCSSLKLSKKSYAIKIRKLITQQQKSI